MAKQTVTKRLYKSLGRKINRLTREGVSTGTLREDIRHMSWRELKKLASVSKSGRATFAGLYDYLKEQPRRDYYGEIPGQIQSENDIPEVDAGYNYGMNVMEELMEWFNTPIPEQIETRKGIRTRSAVVMQEAERNQNILMNLFYTKANEVGFSELGRRLESRADEVHNAIAKCTYGYGDDLRAGFNALMQIINDGALSAQEMQDFSDFADTMMGEEFNM